MKNAFKFGCLSFEEWSGLWKYSEDESDVDGNEYYNFCKDLDVWLRREFSSYPEEFYLWGDFYGDRSVDVEIVNGEMLNEEFIEKLQQYLYANNNWRFKIPTYINSTSVIVVYKDRVFLPKKAGSTSHYTLSELAGLI